MAIHQAAETMNALGGPASVMYVSRKEQRLGERAFACNRGQIQVRRNFSFKKPDKRLDMFDVPRVSQAAKETHFVVPELWPELAWALLNHGCPNVYFWWLSVDNFPMSRLQHLSTLRVIRQAHNLCQSQYAEKFARRYGATTTSMLSDFIDLPKASNPKPTANRKIDITYLSAKAQGAEPLLERLRNRFNVVPLQNMTRDEVRETLLNSKVFLDFGHHPGKDRGPREAALCGCIPVVRRCGAACFNDDVPLPAELLVDTEAFFEPERLETQIANVLTTPENFAARLDAYCQRITQEKSIFEAELSALIQLDR